MNAIASAPALVRTGPAARATAHCWTPVLALFGLFALHWEARDFVRPALVPVSAEAVMSLANAGQLLDGRVVGRTVLVRSRAASDAAAGVRLREQLGLPPDRRWLTVETSNVAALITALARADVHVVSAASRNPRLHAAESEVSSW